MARRYRFRRPVLAQAPKSCDFGHRADESGLDYLGDHEEGNCSKRAGMRTWAHNSYVRAWTEFLKQCHFQDVVAKVHDWDYTERPNTDRRVPDIRATSPCGRITYIIDARIAWNLSTSGISTYDTTGALARAGEVTKRKSWASALARQAPFATTAVVFVPLSCEISGAWGPATERFFNDAIDYINNERDIDFFHWSSVRMSEFWRTSFDVTLASQRARVGTAAAEGDWRKTVQQYGLAEAEALARG